MSGSFKQRLVGFFITPVAVGGSGVEALDPSPLSPGGESEQTVTSRCLEPSVAVFADPDIAAVAGFALALSQLQTTKVAQTAVVLFVGEKPKLRSFWVGRKTRALVKKLCHQGYLATGVGRCAAVYLAGDTNVATQQAQKIMAENYAPTVIVFSCLRDKVTDDLLALQDRALLVTVAGKQYLQRSVPASLSRQMADIAYQELAETYYGRVPVEHCLLERESSGLSFARFGLWLTPTLASQLRSTEKSRK